MVVTLKSILESKDTKFDHMVEHLVEHETPKFANRTPRKSFTAVAHGIIERTPKHIRCPLFDRSKKRVFFTFILHFLLPNLIVLLIMINLIDLLSK